MSKSHSYLFCSARQTSRAKQGKTIALSCDQRRHRHRDPRTGAIGAVPVGDPSATPRSAPVPWPTDRKPDGRSASARSSLTLRSSTVASSTLIRSALWRTRIDGEAQHEVRITQRPILRSRTVTAETSTLSSSAGSCSASRINWATRDNRVTPIRRPILALPHTGSVFWDIRRAHPGKILIKRQMPS